MFSLFILVFLLAQILGTYFLYATYRQNDNRTAKNALDAIVSTIVNNVGQLQSSINHDIGQIVGLALVNGRFLSPANFSIFIDIGTDGSSAISGFRWIPHILNSERASYEAFGRQFYDANFTIRDITFNGTTFNIRPAEVRADYYPFTVSVPPFNLTLMGGDFLVGAVTSQFQDSLTKNSTSASSKVTLLRSDAARNFGTYVSRIVRQNGTIQGVVQALVLPSDLILIASSTTRVPRAFFEISINDVTDGSPDLIFREESNPDMTGATETTIIFFDRRYTVQFLFSRDYTSSLKTTLPTVVLVASCLILLLLDIGLVIVYYQYQRALRLERRDINRRMLIYINHELRNPLHVIINFIDFVIMALAPTAAGATPSSLASSPLEQVLSDLHTIKGHIHLMSHLVNDILTVQALDEKTLALVKQNVTYENIMFTISRSVRAKVTENPNVTFLTEINGNEIFRADPYRLLQVLLNLLSNAIKFTNGGFITLSMKRTGANMYFEVRDTGCGVPPDKVDKLFTRFYHSPSIRGEGTGLGLYLSHSLITIMGGQIGYRPNTIDRDVPVGSIFWFTIPYEPPQDTPIPSTPHDTYALIIPPLVQQLTDLMPERIQERVETPL